MAKKPAEEAILKAYVMEVAATPAGRAVLWQILGMCGVYVNAFDPEPTMSAYIEGKRSIGLELLGMMEDADPLLYPRMQISMNQPIKEEDPDDAGTDTSNT